jgi:hypothetical protein
MRHIAGLFLLAACSSTRTGPATADAGTLVVDTCHNGGPCSLPDGGSSFEFTQTVCDVNYPDGACGFHFELGDTWCRCEPGDPTVPSGPEGCGCADCANAMLASQRCGSR